MINNSLNAKTKGVSMSDDDVELVDLYKVKVSQEIGTPQSFAGTMRIILKEWSEFKGVTLEMLKSELEAA